MTVVARGAASASGCDAGVAVLPRVEDSSLATANRRTDELELMLLRQFPLVDQPTEHLFLPGLYVRRVTNPAGSLVTTMMHKTEHPFFVLRGHLTVKNIATGEVHDLRGGDSGVTKPGTRRIIYAHEDTVFVTVHANPDNETDLSVLEARYIERRELADGKTAHDLFLENYQKSLTP